MAGDLFQCIPVYSGRRTLIALTDALPGLHRLTLDPQAANVVPEIVDYIVWNPEMTTAAKNRLVLNARPDWRLEYRDGHLHVSGRARGGDGEQRLAERVERGPLIESALEGGLVCDREAEL